MDQSENQSVPKFTLDNKKYNSLDEERQSVAQGAQGSQQQFNDLDEQTEITTAQNNVNFNADATQMSDLLNIRDNQINILLQQLYFSKNCSYFYISLLVGVLLLILVTIIDGFKVADSAFCIALELLLNLLITGDFICRLKLTGFRKYFKSNMGNYRWWNFFDLFVVLNCNLFFIISVALRSKKSFALSEGAEQAVLVLWAVWQTLRVILITKKQRLARQNAQTLINFENIVVDTEFGAQSQRSIRLEDQDEIVYQSTTNDDAGKGGQGKVRNRKQGKNSAIEMKEFGRKHNQMYDLELDESNISSKGQNPKGQVVQQSPRVLVFDEAEDD